ncbi:MAG: hypothetical protein RLN88_04375 [Ekhidna sp.]|uniref:hypothetical protein n=1 Tax=Ekhidna sp. TaxID=2608089 RepID=UPI0032ED4DD4
MKKFLLLTFVSVIIIRCNPNEEQIQPDEPRENPGHSYGKVRIDDDPTLKNLMSALQSSSGRVAALDLDSAEYLHDEVLDLTNYSILTSGNRLDRIENIVFVDFDSVYAAYNIIYEPSQYHLANLDTASFLAYFSGTISYQSLETGEIFYATEMQDGVSIDGEAHEGGRTDGDGDFQYGCYIDQQETMSSECFIQVNTYEVGGRVKYTTIKVEKTGKNAGQTQTSTHWVRSDTKETITDITITCHLDTDFSECHYNWFNTNGYQVIPQFSGNNFSGVLSLVPSGGPQLSLLDAIEKQFYDLLEQDPFALIQNCDQIENWQALAQHTPPQEVIDKIQNLDDNYTSIISGDWDIQYIKDAKGPVVNLDYFPVKITQLPINPNTGNRFGPTGFFNYVRKNLNTFFANNSTEFGPYNDDELLNWLSDDYLGTIMRFDIDLPGPFQQDGSVICSDQKNRSWIFTTIESPQDWNHPVSGNRQFGLEQNQDGSYTFFTRGVDRVAETFDNFVGDLPIAPSAFEGADALWSAFQDNLENYINDPANGGQAQKENPQIDRPDWDKVNEVLMGTRPISDLGCN